jgi:hypothetical protein
MLYHFGIVNFSITAQMRIELRETAYIRVLLPLFAVSDEKPRFDRQIIMYS